ncbi:MAG: hypothetical protein ACJAV6_000266 [Candidatus Paceibacteria bacterium]
MVNKRQAQKTRREKKRGKKKTIVSIIALFVVVANTYYIMNHEYLAIDRVIIEGQRTLIEDDVREAISEYLAERPLGLLRRDNVIFLNTNKVQRSIKKALPKIEDIDIRIEDGDTLMVTIGERSAHSLWCLNKDYESIFDEECYFADQDGLLYSRAPYFSGSVYMKFFTEPVYDEEEVEINYIGTEVEVVDSFVDFFDFLELLESEYLLDVTRVFFDEFDDVSLEISRLHNKIYFDTKPMILYNQSDSYKKIGRNIGVVLSFEDFEKDFTYRPSALESIDVRFDGRVFYTFTPIGGKTNTYDEKTLENNQTEVIEE